MYVITGEMIIKSLQNITVNAASLENHIIYKQFLVVRKNTEKHTVFIKSDAIQNFDNNKLSILIKHESCVSVCLFVRVFQSHQKTQGHEILALGLIWPNLKQDEARFSKF